MAKQRPRHCEESSTKQSRGFLGSHRTPCQPQDRHVAQRSLSQTPTRRGDDGRVSSEKKTCAHHRTQPSAHAELRRSMSGATETRSRPCLPSPPALSQMGGSAGCLTFVSWERGPKPRRNGRVEVRWHGISALKHGVIPKRSNLRTQPAAHAELRRSMSVSHRIEKHSNLNSPPPKNTSAALPSLLPPSPHAP